MRKLQKRAYNAPPYPLAGSRRAPPRLAYHLTPPPPPPPAPKCWIRPWSSLTSRARGVATSDYRLSREGLEAAHVIHRVTYWYFVGIHQTLGTLVDSLVPSLIFIAVMSLLPYVGLGTKVLLAIMPPRKYLKMLTFAA